MHAIHHNIMQQPDAPDTPSSGPAYPLVSTPYHTLSHPITQCAAGQAAASSRADKGLPAILYNVKSVKDEDGGRRYVDPVELYPLDNEEIWRRSREGCSITGGDV